MLTTREKNSEVEADQAPKGRNEVSKLFSKSYYKPYYRRLRHETNLNRGFPIRMKDIKRQNQNPIFWTDFWESKEHSSNSTMAFCFYGIRSACKKWGWKVPDRLAYYQAYLKLKMQDMRCEVIGCTKAARNIDHDHNTGRIRGVVCAHCNHLLSVFDGGHKPNYQSYLNYLK